MSIRRQNRPAIFNWMGASLLGMVLVYGLIAAPLMVVCIPPDGNPLVEFIGQDPCHHPWAHPSQGDRLPVMLGESDQENLCVDLFLYSYGVTQTSLDLQSPPRVCVEQLSPSLTAAPWSLYFVESGGLFKLAREPIAPAVLDPRLSFSLRI